MIVSWDNATINVELIAPIAMKKDLHIAIGRVSVRSVPVLSVKLLNKNQGV
jgi:translation elongation factor EF-Tu-like GTPase